MTQEEKTSSNQEPTKLYLPKYCILEAPIRLCKEVSESAKIYFGELAVLASKYNYIPYTNEQLAEMKECGVSTIKRWNEELEKNGFIERETKNVLVDGKQCQWKKERKMYIFQTPDLKKFPDRLKNEPIIDRLKNEPIDEGLKNEPILNKIEDKTKNNITADPVDDVFSDSPKEEPEPTDLRSMDATNFDESFRETILSLKKDFRDPTSTYSQIEIDRAIRILKSSNPDNPRGLFRDALVNPEKYEEKVDKVEAKKIRIDENKRIAEKYFNKIKGITSGDKMEILNKYIEVGNGIHQPSVVEYDASDFEEKLKEALKKWRLLE